MKRVETWRPISDSSESYKRVNDETDECWLYTCMRDNSLAQKWWWPTCLPRSLHLFTARIDCSVSHKRLFTCKVSVSLYGHIKLWNDILANIRWTDDIHDQQTAVISFIRWFYQCNIIFYQTNTLSLNDYMLYRAPIKVHDLFRH